VDDAPARERQKVVGSDVKFINSKLEHFQNQSNVLLNARNLRDACRPKLVNIKNELGAADNFYIDISSAVVLNITNMIIAVTNGQQRKLSSGTCTLNSLTSTIQSAVALLNAISSFEMNMKTRSWFSKNKTTIDIVLRLQSSSSSTSSGGCYIATMVYGDYNHPQVLLLREFRDEKLLNTLLGRAFVSFYYATSPHLVKLLQNATHINRMIRKILDSLIRRINK
jgi:hypothetical protein